MKSALPLLAALALGVLLSASLFLDPGGVPSPRIGEQAPAFSLPSLHDASRRVSPDEMKGRPWLLNVWASWCVGCRVEHPLLMRLRKEDVAILGLNYKDGGDAARAWLEAHGDPYEISVADADGAAALDWGVYGVPETFVIDAGGAVRHRHAGPLDSESIRVLLSMLRAPPESP